jgi:hypothetical protein
MPLPAFLSGIAGDFLPFGRGESGSPSWTSLEPAKVPQSDGGWVLGPFLWPWVQRFAYGRLKDAEGVFHGV